MFMYVFHIGSALLIMLGCGFVFCWKTNKGFWSYFLLGWAFQFLLCIPAGLWQGVFSWPGISSSSSLPWKIFVTPLLGWPFNAGGYTVRWVFETTVVPLEWLVGHRSAIVMSNMGYYTFLLAVQGCILAGLFAWRYKIKKKMCDWFLICLGLLFLINSLINVRWFWAGT